MKKLYRSTKNTQFAGVLGGIGELYSIDVSLLRILTVVSGFFTGGMVWLIYIIAAVVMPTDKELE
ncbi:PspC domain-containing protein [Halobacillus sp. Marseille-P3879]|uniref:PspC domain-containing protein n=1 Tax=Halobacillus TaxID=45667 RepID=UPI000C7998EB|nr:PspC domain-containing protein [Halobacillus sp. Marseille-P3879]